MDEKMESRKRGIEFNLRPPESTSGQCARSDACSSRNAVEGRFDVKIEYFENLSFDYASKCMRLRSGRIKFRDTDDSIQYNRTQREGHNNDTLRLPLPGVVSRLKTGFEEAHQ